MRSAALLAVDVTRCMRQCYVGAEQLSKEGCMHFGMCMATSSESRKRAEQRGLAIVLTRG
jgi:hypothetical protein